jgi:hypothetical protein
VIAEDDPMSTPARAKETPIEPLPLEERIRRRAYELYIQRDSQSGSELDDWLQAEEEILRAEEAAIDEASEESFQSQRPTRLLTCELPERFQRPFIGGHVASEDTQVAIIRAHFEKRVLRTIPLVEHFLNHVVPLSKLKAHRPLVRLRSRVAFHPQRHSLYYAFCVQWRTLVRSFKKPPNRPSYGASILLGGLLPFQNTSV